MNEESTEMAQGRSAMLSVAEFLSLTIIFIANYDLIVSPSVIEDWKLQDYISKTSLLPITLLGFAFLHFIETRREARHRQFLFRKAPSQGIVLGSVLTLSVCLQHFKCFESLVDKDDRDSVLNVYKNYAIAMSFSNLFYGILFILNIDIAFFAPVVILLLGFLQDHLTDVNFIVPLGAVLLYFIIFFGLIKLCPKSFTIAEGTMISQGTTLMVIDFSLLIIVKSSYNYLLRGYDANILEKRSDEMLSLSALFTSTIFISVSLSPIFYYLAWYTKTVKDNVIYSAAFYVGGIMNGFAIFIPVIYFVLGINPVWFITSLLTPAVIGLISYWIFLLIIAIVIVIWNTDYNLKAEKKLAPNIIIRKFFHFVAILIFLPGIYFQPNFTKLASGIAFVALVVIEYVRIFRIYPFGDILDKYLVSFVDERDSGKVILTHLYLLIGFSMPVWLFPFNSGQSLCKLLPYSGVISLGVGDTFASIIGKFYGQIKLPGTSKTYLGLSACIISQFVASLVLMVCVAGHISWHDSARIFAAVSITSIVECVTSQIDNLILSPVLYTALTLLFTENI